MSRVVSVKVDNLGEAINAEDLKASFEKFGEIKDAYVPFDPRSRKPRPFGFVRYATQEEADAAIAGMNNTDIKGQIITCSIAQYDRKERRRHSRSRSYRRDDRREDRRDDRRGDAPRHRDYTRNDDRREYRDDRRDERRYRGRSRSNERRSRY